MDQETDRYRRGLLRAAATLCCLLSALLFAERSLAETGGGPPRLTLPAEFFAVVGRPISIYHDNIVLTETPESYRFSLKCDIGVAEKTRWTVAPGPSDVGRHRLRVAVADAAGTPLAEAATTLRVVPADAGSQDEIRLLLVGDSLTHATLYANELARLLSQPGNPKWTMLGTHRPDRAAAGVAHEGYGGWTWQRFVSQYEANPDGTHRKRSSPFVYLESGARPALNVKRYIAEQCGGQPPDSVFFLLGINDCFRADPADPAAIDARIDGMFVHADKLLAAFRAAAPHAELAICLTTPPNAREAGFQANYRGRFHRWGWKRIQHRLVERQIQRYTGREEEQLFIVPTQLNLDPVDGYPTDNGVHPNAAGYRQIADSIYAWIKMRRAQAEP